MLTINVEQLATYRLGMEKGIEQGLEQGIEQGLEQGIEQGARQQAFEIAKNMLQTGFSPAQVANLTGLPLADIQQLQASRDNVQ